MILVMDRESWEEGYRSGLESKEIPSPNVKDARAYWAGYIEGKAERESRIKIIGGVERRGLNLQLNQQ